MTVDVFRDPGVRKTFIVSGGRTATMLFGKRFGESFGDVFSVHEPDVVDITRNGFRSSISGVARQGVFRMGVLKSLGLAGSRNLSLKRLRGSIDHDRALDWFIKDRRHLAHINRPIYLEANYQLFGVVEDIISLPNSRAILIIRDPRTWIESWLKKRWYSRSDLLTQLDFLGFRRITPRNVGISEPTWNHFDRVEKLAWVWGFLARSFAEQVSAFPDKVSVFRFEDILGGSPIVDTQRQLLKIIFGEDGADQRLAEYRHMIRHKDNATPRESIDVRLPSWFWRDFGDLLRKYQYE